MWLDYIEVCEVVETNMFGNSEEYIYMDAYYYDKESNIMMDVDGSVVHDIFRIITPNQLRLFKEKKECFVVQSRTGDPVELVYPESPGIYEYNTPNKREEY